MDLQKYLTTRIENCYNYNPTGRYFEVFEKKGRGKLELTKNKKMFQDEEKPKEEETPETPEEKPEEAEEEETEEDGEEEEETEE